MSKATDTEIKDLIGVIDRKLDFLTQEVSGIKSEISGIKSEVSGIKSEVSTIKIAIDKMDNRIWAFGGLILAACLGALLKALNI